jgi:phage gpG-like protein
MATTKRETHKQQVEGIASLGGVFVEIEQQFINADYSETLEPFLRVFEGTHAAGFAAEASPSGSKWRPLSPRTIKRKGHGIILYETGRLKASLIGATGDSVRAVSHRGLLFGTEVPYSIFHQDGTSRLPQREHVGINDETCQSVVDAIADAVVETLKSR